MQEKEFTAFMKEDARKHNMCDKVFNAWNDEYTKQDLITLWKNNFDYAIEHDYPSVEFIKENFDKELLEKNGIYVDKEKHVYLENGMYVFNGNCECNVEQGDFRCSNIYVRHKCKLNIKMGFVGDMHIHVYDNAFVKIDKSNGSKCFVYLDGGDAEVSEGVVVRDRRRK